MEKCEKGHLNCTSSTEEKQLESFNSSELDDAMNELLTQDPEEPGKNISITTEEDLLDMMDEKPETRHAMKKLKFYTTKKILRRAKYLRERNYNVVHGSRNSPKVPSNQLTHTSNARNERATVDKLLRFKTSETLNKLDEQTSQKIQNVIKSGNLTVQRLKTSEISDDIKHKFTLIDKTKFITPSSYELSQSSLAPESFPKAIVYPDTKKVNVQNLKAADHAKMSFNEVFTKATEEQIKTTKSIDQAASKTESAIKPKVRVLTPKSKKISKVTDVENESTKSEPFKYLIPQNLLASKNSKLCVNSNKNDSNASTSKSDSSSISSESSENLSYTHSVIPERPQINYDLIDALADYRVIAKYLFNKLNVPTIDFDATDDYINLYKLSRN